MVFFINEPSFLNPVDAEYSVHSLVDTSKEQTLPSPPANITLTSNPITPNISTFPM